MWKNFCRAWSLKSHLLTHTGEKLQKCRQCNYSTNHLSGLREHIMKHTGEKPYKCNQCNYSSKHSTHVKYHNRTHSGEHPHRCTMCEYSCKISSSLKVHTMMKSRTSVTNATAPPLLQVICKDTLKRTQGWDLSSAANAAKLSCRRLTWQDILLFTKIEVIVVYNNQFILCIDILDIDIKV